MTKKRRRLCFVIMPFSGIKGICTERQWTTIFEKLVKPTAESAGYECRRSKPTRGNIVRHIINDLADADAVIADVTGDNANVFYELGARHAIRGRSILIAQHTKYIRSDLRSYAHYIYDWRTQGGKDSFRAEVGSLLHALSEDTEREDNPVEDFLHLTDEREILRLATQKTSTLQLEASQAVLHDSAHTLRQIHKGRIPIKGGATGYFQQLLKLIDRSPPRQILKVFVNLIPLEERKSFGHFELKGAYADLWDLEREKRTSLEYIFALRSRGSLRNPKARAHIDKVRDPTRKIRLFFADTTDVPNDVWLKGIVLLPKLRIAFNHQHEHSADGRLINIIMYVNDDATFKELTEQYDKIRLDSRQYYPKPKPERFS
ncbi:MAG TPA: hypothetical protein VL486_11175 [Verrucomicrobiae bacterium]|nr:hypothetical protein [Verrucomicrobiae bacterium]